MKQREILEVKPIYDGLGNLNRENSVVINSWELIPEKRKKPDRKSLEQLRYIKNLRKQNKFYEASLYPERTIEYNIGTLANQKKRRKNKEQQINNIVLLLKKIQNDRHILSVSKEFINDILKIYSKLSERCRQLILKEILKRGKEREIIKTEKRLKDIPHYEHKIFGERKISKSYGVNKEWVTRNIILKTYSFNN